MDLNYLYFRQQVEYMRADVAGQSNERRQAHRALARFYGTLIDRRRSDLRPGGA